uniref:Probable oligoribonuclease n=1 Tax=Lutzomyia longipalpis TaxID=7200 RepID=A0A1B0CEV4_LUTLO
MSSKNLIWMDMEMTGLDIKKDRILEVACIVTDTELNVISMSEDYIIHQPDDILRGMDEWCVKTHGESGLTEACRKSKFTVDALARKLTNNLVRREFSLKMSSKNLIWMDMEMTGLDIKKDRILEVACIVTDPELNVISMSEDYIIHQPDDILRGMDEWCVKTHGESGLTEACRKSKFTVDAVEEELLNFLKQHAREKECPLAGNSVYMDKLFMLEHMPRLADFLHYRIVDVSTVKELCRRWNTDIYWKAPKKKLTHRALDDILESIEELKYYRKFMFLPQEK